MIINMLINEFLIISNIFMWLHRHHMVLIEHFKSFDGHHSKNNVFHVFSSAIPLKKLKFKIFYKFITSYYFLNAFISLFFCHKNLFKYSRNSVKTHLIPILTPFYGKLKLFMKILFQTLSLLYMLLKSIEFQR